MVYVEVCCFCMFGVSVVFVGVYVVGWVVSVGVVIVVFGVFELIFVLGGIVLYMVGGLII